MKVYVDPIPNSLSKAMFRVANALRTFAPAGVTVVSAPEHADLQVLHVTNLDAIATIRASKYAVIQYCLATGAEAAYLWNPLWDQADLVWSYYDLSQHLNGHAPFYYAPLGIDAAFLNWLREMPEVPRIFSCFTSGYVAGPGAEAIEEVADAALAINRQVFHLGPVPRGITKPFRSGWSRAHNLDDQAVASFYARSQYVSGLRHVEGFEFPVIEGLLCGARPIVFDRPETRQWFNGHAIFVTETSGEPLVNTLTHLLVNEPKLVSVLERAEVAEKFNWETLVKGFWERVL